MKLKSYIFLLFSSLNHIAFSQRIQQTQAQFKNTSMFRVIEVFDFNGNSLAYKPYDKSIQGSPFLFDDFQRAQLKFGNGKGIIVEKCNLNLENNDLLVIDSNNQTLIVKPGLIKEIIFLNEDSLKEVTYKSGFPSFDNKDSTTFYEVLVKGKIQLIKRNYKKINSSFNELTRLYDKEFVEYTRTYVFTNGNLKEYKPNTTFVLSLFDKNQKFVNSYLNENNLNFKKIEEVKKLISYYNNL
ncbi:MAG: hypothetical protein ACOVMM_09120 [Chitinophagaceae bacterium]